MATENERVPQPTAASQAPTPAGAVFLSYASEDAAVAQRIANALRSGGIEVWFDREELRGGDAWDRQIRTQIHECRLFMPIVSANTEARVEGYFRREWKLAVDRTHDLSDRVAFLVPVVIDSTVELKADVPDAFRHIQWTRLPGGEPSSVFVDRVRRLLSPDVSPGQAAANSVPPGPPALTMPTRPLGTSGRSKAALWLISAVLAVGLIYLVAERFWISKHSQAPAASNANAPPAAAAAFNPPPHSVAVLPFVNMSGDASQEYFSDGLTEELLNSLARINELQVSARTSSFAFKGKDTDLSTIAHKLNVASVLEGSVRRSGKTVRITAQLNNALTGFHLWSQTYDRDLRDVLKLQTEIADAVANGLKLTLLGDVAAKVELGGTRNPAAFDAYLRALKTHELSHDERDAGAAVTIYTEAIDRDPNFALGYAGRSLALIEVAGYRRGTAYRDTLDQAKADATKALALAPELAEGHLAAAVALETSLDFTPARQEFERALQLAPGNARVLRNYGVFAVFMGESSSGLTATRRAVALDPLNPNSHVSLGSSLLFLGHYQESLAAFADAHALDPDDPDSQKAVGWAYYLLGDLQSARSLCESKPETLFANWCLAVIYKRLGRHSDAQAMLAKLQAARGDDGAYEYAVTYAQWGETARAVDWLETAMRLHQPKLERVKVNALLDPLRMDQRFQAIERALKFPD